MMRIAIILVVAVGIGACDMISTLTDGWRYASAVESDLETSTGMKPEVGFNWKNGRLTRVTVSFPRLYEAKPLAEFAETVRAAVTNRFKQTPDDIVLAFSLRSPAASKTAQLGLADAWSDSGIR
jgi:hypothetical protein